jgi:hypothetical protein
VFWEALPPLSEIVLLPLTVIDTVARTRQPLVLML